MLEATFVAGLLEACPGVTVLVTSRAPLQIEAEVAYAVPELDDHEAAQLFVERVQALQPAYALREADRAAITAVCTHLDNLPLAIELIAVRGQSLSPAELVKLLEPRLPALASGPRDLPARHQTLRSAIAWSYDRLGAVEQRLFACLGVFAGGFTVEAAQAVAAEPPDVAPVLESLCAASLIQKATPVGGARYHLLETIREFAQEQLAAAGDERAARQRHAAYFTQMADETRRHLSFAGQTEWYARLSADLDNLRAVLSWAEVEGAHESLLRITVPLYHFWWQRGLIHEGLRWLEVGLAGRAAAPLDLQAEALVHAGIMLCQQDAYAPARAYLLEGLEAARQSGNQGLARGTLANLGGLALFQGQFDQVEPYLAEAVALSHSLNDDAYARFTLTVLADLHCRQGQFAAARDDYAQALAINRDCQDQEGVADSLWGLARALQGLAEVLPAAQYCTEALAAYRALGHEQGVGWVLNVQAALASDAGQFDQASALFRQALDIRLKHHDKQGCTRVLDQAAVAGVRAGRWQASVHMLAAADTIRGELGGRMTGYEQRVRDAALQQCRDALGQAAYAAAWWAGQGLTLPQAVALVG